MYAKILKKPMKQKPRRSNVYRVYEWHPHESGQAQGYFTGKGEIQRDLKDCFGIHVCMSKRECRNKEKQSWHIATVSFWDIVDEWLLCGRDAEEFNIISSAHVSTGIKKSFPDDVGYAEVYSLLSAKLKPLTHSVIDEYQEMEEFRFFLMNERKRQVRERNEYNQKAARAKKQREHEERMRTIVEERMKQIYDQIRQSCRLELSDNAPALSDPEKATAKLFIKEAYRSLSKKMHPDQGGTDEAFKRLTKVKEHFERLT